MLPKHQRLNLKKDFKWVRAGKLINTTYATVYIRLGDNTSPKVGIATSSKVFKKANQRNKARRVLSQALQVLYPKLNSSINIVALPKTSIFDVKSGDVLLDLEGAFLKVGILNEKSSD